MPADVETPPHGAGVTACDPFHPHLYREALRALPNLLLLPALPLFPFSTFSPPVVGEVRQWALYGGGGVAAIDACRGTLRSPVEAPA